jgi:hypothetical protein
MMFQFSWKYDQKPKNNQKMGTLSILSMLTKMGGQDLSNHVWGAPFVVGFESRANAEAARELVEEYYDTSPIT